MIYLDKIFVALAFVAFPIFYCLGWKKAEGVGSITRLLVSAYCALAGTLFLGAVYLLGLLGVMGAKFLFS